MTARASILIADDEEKILAESGLSVIPADSMSDAAEKIVAAVRG